MPRKSLIDPPLVSPIPFTAGSNGEFVPDEPGAAQARAEARFRDLVDVRCRRLGVSRRAFLDSAAGTATALLVLQELGGCRPGGGPTGGGYVLDEPSTWDSARACEAIAGGQFVFDVQTHHVDARGAWRDTDERWQHFMASLPTEWCHASDEVECFDREHYIREIFVNSDTHVAVLSNVPAEPGQHPLDTAEQAATRAVIEQLSHSERLVIHGLVHPERGEQALERMQQQKEVHRIAAWKVYTLWGDWRLDDDTGRAFLDRARQLDVKIVCAHKGLPLFDTDPAFARPDDVGPAAKAYPDLKFLVYHSAYDTGVTEGPYDPEGAGIDRLIRTCMEHGIGPDGNVWAELGATWRHLMSRPVAAQHAIGKLLKYFGPERILWGTDSIWFGSPQGQLDAFRAFTISEELQEKHGYPPLTEDVKAKILGLNAAAVYGIDPAAQRCAIEADALAQHKQRVAAEPRLRRRAPAFGPQTRQQFLAMIRELGGSH
ncbi:hypothetical protein SAMN02745121_01115 [Nannocystis exedens]|uniref:Amidohydrolase-related domain-containing protein n=1 Tax=Nannocystis exedens TaxID=54 RepID=A0A1I1UJB8_9BACT|nr:amidohydrolase family protein [Nannocystis exedens]PCC71571.1 Amidohydrolase [Nannocystis exedens]SFD68050.1 hypothetical protein SAMN02745121_01115 [Nannocystis exedens]